MKFLVPNYSCLQNPWLWGYRPQIPFFLLSVLNWIFWTPPPPRTKFLGTPLVQSAPSISSRTARCTLRLYLWKEVQENCTVGQTVGRWGDEADVRAQCKWLYYCGVLRFIWCRQQAVRTMRCLTSHTNTSVPAKHLVLSVQQSVRERNEIGGCSHAIFPKLLDFNIKDLNGDLTKVFHWLGTILPHERHGKLYLSKFDVILTVHLR